MEEICNRFKGIDRHKINLVLFLALGLLSVLPYLVFPIWIIATFFAILATVFLVVLFFELKKGFLLFVCLIAIAPPLYLILPISSIARSIRLYEILFLLIFVFAFMHSAIHNKPLLYRTPIDVPMAVVLFLWAVSLLYGSYLQPDYNLRDFFSFLKPIRLFLIGQMVIYFADDRSDLKKIIYLLIICSAYPQILGIFEHFKLFGVRRFLATVYPGYEYSPTIIVGGFDVFGAGFLHKFRSSSVFVGDVNAYGGYSALFFLMAFILCMNVIKRKTRIFFAVICLLNLYGVLISESRKALFCIVIGIVTIIGLKFKRAIKGIPIFILSFLFILKYIPEGFEQRLFKHWEYKLQNLLKLWSQYREFELSTLLFGKGAVHHFGIDSFYLKLLLSGGILGLVAHFILIYFILRVSIYVMRNSQCRLDELTGMMAIVITISIEWLNATGLYFYSGRISESFWVILGSVFVLYRIMQKEKTGVHIESITMYENRD